MTFLSWEQMAQHQRIKVMVVGASGLGWQEQRRSRSLPELQASLPEVGRGGGVAGASSDL